jgi:hypothetical protein
VRGRDRMATIFRSTNELRPECCDSVVIWSDRLKCPRDTTRVHSAFLRSGGLPPRRCSDYPLIRQRVTLRMRRFCDDSKPRHGLGNAIPAADLRDALKRTLQMHLNASLKRFREGVAR